eukprot:2710421-Karenia_brevis.AAC.1
MHQSSIFSYSLGIQDVLVICHSRFIHRSSRVTSCQSSTIIAKARFCDRVALLSLQIDLRLGNQRLRPNGI